MNEIKVCHLTSVHPAKDGRIFYKECTSLVNAGYDVTLIVAGAMDEVCNGVKIVGVSKSKGRLRRILQTTKEVYKKAIEVNADIYHFHDPELLPYGLKLKKKGKKVIFDSHEFVGEQIKTKEYIPRAIRGFIAKTYNLFEGYVCKKIDAVVAVCTIDGKDYFKGRSRRRFFINNAPIISKEPDDVQFRFGSLKRVVHVGALSHERGITSLAEAVARTDCKLILIGTFFSSEYKKKIEEICGKTLEYKGAVPLKDVPILLRECGIGTSTLLDKGQYAHIDVLPTKIYDYMLAGLPVIMSEFPYLVEFNKKYNVGLCVDPAEPNTIVEAIQFLNSHPDIAKEMGENGRRAIETEFNWGTQEKVLLELYSTL